MNHDFDPKGLTDAEQNNQIRNINFLYPVYRHYVF